MRFFPMIFVNSREGICLDRDGKTRKRIENIVVVQHRLFSALIMLFNSVLFSRWRQMRSARRC